MHKKDKEEGPKKKKSRKNQELEVWE